MAVETLPEWVRASRRFLRFLETGNPALTSLRDELAILVRLAHRTEEPDAVSADIADIHADKTRWAAAASRFYADFGEYVADGEDGFAFFDLVEIAEDLERCLTLHDQADPDALWEWRFGFEMHWGSMHASPLLFHLERELGPAS